MSGRLVCRWLHGVGAGGAGATVVVAEQAGWWYTAALPGGKRVLAFHTDADLPSAKDTRTSTALFARAQAQTGLATLLKRVSFEPSGPVGYCAAHSTWITEATGPGWLAVGDAALSCDPLSSQGLLNALYTAYLAASALQQALTGDGGVLMDYQRAIDRVVDAYRTHLAAWYAMETRWPDSPFWARRCQIGMPRQHPGAAERLAAR